MSKEELIKEAYGEYWNNLKQAIDSNGWIEISWMQENEVNIDFDLKTNYENGMGQDLARPKSLQGIENNNGWVKILSEDDLPKEDNVGYMVCKNTDMLFNTSITKSTVIYLYNTGKITHYQPIAKPQPPLY